MTVKTPQQIDFWQIPLAVYQKMLYFEKEMCITSKVLCFYVVMGLIHLAEGSTLIYLK